MPKTVRELRDSVLGPDTWLGRALRAPVNFLSGRASAQMRRKTKELNRALEHLRRETKQLQRTARHEKEVVQKTRLELKATQERLTNLEALLLEHPKVRTGNAAGRSGTSTAFPSPAVSVVMPTWNREALIVDAIESVLAQSFTDWELIVVDDGSTDGTKEAVACFADSRIRYIEKNHAGQCAARNHALSLARGPLIAYLDSDNVWYPTFLAYAVAAFSVDASMQSAYGARVSDPPAEKRLLFEPFDRDKLLKASFIGMSSFIHRRTLYEQFGGFDESLRALEDWDLVLRYTQDSPAHRLPVLAACVTA